MDQSDKDADPEFLSWLSSFIEKYQALNDTQKETTVVKLLDVIGPNEKWLLQNRVPDFLFRDFVSNLPLEILEKVLSFLSCQDLLNCCQVSKSWSGVLSDPRIPTIWRARASQLGIRPAPQSQEEIVFFKKLAIYGLKLREQMKRGSCFETFRQTFSVSSRDK